MKILLQTLQRWSFDTRFSASGARVRTAFGARLIHISVLHTRYAARRVSKHTPTDSSQRVSKWILTGAISLFVGMIAPAMAQARPVVVELFTSEACSSCPPAEALIARLQKSDPNILALSFHVNYWDGPAWKDKFSLAAATDRQTWYVGLKKSQEVYTPEAVVDGTAQMVGSNEAAVTNAIASADTSNAVTVGVNIGQMITIHVGDGTGADAVGGAKIWLFGYDTSHTTQIGGGENGGATIHEVNVVRSIMPLGTWTDIASTYNMPKPLGEHVAVLLQAANGQILGAASD